MQKPTAAQLNQIIEALDASINCAITTPHFAGGEALHQAEEICRSVTSQNAFLPSPAVNGGCSEDYHKVALLWAIRTRLGRLKVLVDSAGDFYRSLSADCIVGRPAASRFLPRMDYDVQGEWKEPSTSGLLSIDC